MSNNIPPQHNDSNIAEHVITNIQQQDESSNTITEMQ